MTRTASILLVLCAIPALAQFESIDLRFEGVGCASCVESIPARIQRLRGVESVTVDAAASLVKIRLAPANRIRLEQVRDLIEQDGTKVRSAHVAVRGEIASEAGSWMLQPAGGTARYRLPSGDWKQGETCRVLGSIADLRPEGGIMTLTGKRHE